MKAADHGRQGALRLPTRTLVLGALLAGAMVVVIGHFSEGVRFSEMLRRARPAWLLGALALQLLTYAARAAVWGVVLRRDGRPLPLHRLTRLSFGKHFTDQALPSAGLSGTLLIVRGLTRRGAPRRTVMAAFVLQTAGSSAGMVLAMGGGLLILRHTLGEIPRLVQLGALLWVAMNTLIAGVALLLSRGRRVPLPGRVKHLRPVRALLDATGEADPRLIRDPRLVVSSTLLNAVVPVLDGLTLWTLVRSLGITAPASDVFVAFVIAMMARDLSLVPGALGTFDAACVGVLTLVGLDLAPAAAATLLFRGFSLWLPLLPGLLAARGELRSAGQPAPTRRVAPPRRSRRVEHASAR